MGCYSRNWSRWFAGDVPIPGAGAGTLSGASSAGGGGCNTGASVSVRPAGCYRLYALLRPVRGRPSRDRPGARGNRRGDKQLNLPAGGPALGEVHRNPRGLQVLVQLPPLSHVAARPALEERSRQSHPASLRVVRQVLPDQVRRHVPRARRGRHHPAGQKRAVANLEHGSRAPQASSP